MPIHAPSIASQFVMTNRHQTRTPKTASWPVTAREERSAFRSDIGMSARSRSNDLIEQIFLRRRGRPAARSRCIWRSPATGWRSTSAARTAPPWWRHLLSLTPFRRIVKDYFMICDSYYQAIRTATPDKIEAIDMGRRGIHDEGSRTLQERLKARCGSIRNLAAAVHA